jgi:hypothetical protein
LSEENGGVPRLYSKKESIQQAILRIDGWAFRPGQRERTVLSSVSVQSPRCYVGYTVQSTIWKTEYGTRLLVSNQGLVADTPLDWASSCPGLPQVVYGPSAALGQHRTNVVSFGDSMNNDSQLKKDGMNKRMSAWGLRSPRSRGAWKFPGPFLDRVCFGTYDFIYLRTDFKSGRFYSRVICPQTGQWAGLNAADHKGLS